MKKVKQRAYFLLFVSLTMIAGLMVSCNDKDSNSGKVELLSFGPCPIPRGGELHIMGNNLDQVGSVVLPGCDAISDFMTKSAREITLTVPKSAEDGKIVLRAGKQEITSISNFVINGSVVLTGFSPLTAKAGDVVRLEGKDFDFVQEVVFTSDVHVLKADFVSQTKEAIEVEVPVKAQSGSLGVSGVLQGSQVMVYFEGDINITLPTLASFSPEIIRAGNVLTITGKDFDLVESVSFGGGKTAESFTVDATKTSITVTVPADAQDGFVVLTAFSGVKIPSAEELVMVVPTITSISPNPVNGGDILTITGTDLDLIVKVTFGGDRVGEILEGGTATQIEVKVPESAKDGKVIFTTLANKSVRSDDELEVIVEDTEEIIIWEGSKAIGWGNPLSLKTSEFEDIPAGAVMTLYFEQEGGWPQAQLCRAVDGWPQYKFSELDDNGTINPSYFGSNTSIELVLTQSLLDEMLATNDNGNCMHIQGDGITFTKVTIKVPKSGTIIWEGSTSFGNGWSVWLQLTDASLFADAKVGQVMYVSISAVDMSDGWAQVLLKNSEWGDLDGTVKGANADTTEVEYQITQELLDVMQSGGIIMGGYMATVSKIVIK